MKGIKVKKNLLVAMLVLVVMTVSFPLNSFAASDDYYKELGFTKEEVEHAAEEAEMIRPYFTDNDGQISFDTDAARKNGVSEGLIKRTEADLSQVNRYLNVSTNSELAACNGLNYWGYPYLYLDSCTANKVAAALTAGASLSTLIGLLPGGTPLAVTLAVLGGVGAAAISYANSEGNGVKILLALTGGGNFIPVWVRSQ